MARRVVLEVAQAEVKKGRPWWQTAPIDEFKRWVETLVGSERDEVRRVLLTAKDEIGYVINDNTSDEDHRRRARFALVKIKEKLRIIGMTTRSGTAWPPPPDPASNTSRRKLRRRETARNARAALAAGDLHAAMVLLIDFHDPDFEWEKE